MWRLLPRIVVSLAISVLAGCEVTGDRPADAQPFAVGLLLPLSGEHAVLGHSMLDAAQMALEKHPGSQIEILPQDTKGTPEGARQAAQSALDAGVRLLVGPVFRGDAAAVVPLARRARVEVVTFSNDRTLIRDGVFVFGLDPEQKIARLAELAGERGLETVTLFARYRLQPAHPRSAQEGGERRAPHRRRRDPLSAAHFVPRDGATGG